jgi:NADH-quinone oxidoreductase subunit G
VTEQWPIVGRGDLYYGGTGYDNTQGLGVQLALSGTQPSLSWPQLADFRLPKLGLMAFPVTRLYDRGTTLVRAKMLHQRIGEPYIVLSVEDATRLKVSQGTMVRLVYSGSGEGAVLAARIDAELPERVVLVPRSFGMPVSAPTSVEIRAA